MILVFDVLSPAEKARDEFIALGVQVVAMGNITRNEVGVTFTDWTFHGSFPLQWHLERAIKAAGI